MVVKLRRGQWRARRVPELRRDLVRSLMGHVSHLQGMVVRATGLGDPRFVVEFMDGVHQTAEQLAAAERAVMFWVGADMAALALDAATDCPGITALDALAPAGLVVVEEPLPVISTDPIGGLYLRSGGRTGIHHTAPVPVDGLLWEVQDDTLILVPLCRADRLPHPMLAVAGQLVPLMTLRVPLPGILGQLDAATMDGEPVDPGQTLGIAAWLSSMWVMSRQPSTTRTTRMDARNGETGLARVPRAQEVTIVDIRPAPYRSSDPNSSGGGRKLTTRHLVRGHWTHQPHGPGRAQRRLQWVDSYIRGPEGAPLVQRERVWAWRT